MIIDEKGKLFGKISIIDICVILIVIIGIAGMYITYSNIREGKLDGNANVALNSSNALETAEIDFKLNEVRDVTKNSIIVGDSVYTAKEGTLIGTIKNIEAKPTIKNVVSDNGAVYQATVPEKFDVTIIVEVKGVKIDNGFYTENGEQLLYGDEFEIKTSTIKTTPVISGIKVK